MHPNVKYELAELEKLLQREKTGGRESMFDSGLNKKVQSETERIKQTLVFEVFNFEDERHLERYVQYHQQALIRLIDKASLLMDVGGAKSKHKPYYSVLYKAFDELLSFIERHFTKYFDQDSKAPESYIALARKDALANMAMLESRFNKTKADNRLVELVFHIVKKIIDNKSGISVSYRNVMYSKEVQKELFRVLDKYDQSQDINEELRQVMYYLNYNSTKVLTYHAHFISMIVDSAETRAEKIEKLSFILKRIHQAQVKPATAYNQHAPSLKSQLSNYISEELDYHERLQQLANRMIPPPGDNFMDGFKLKFEASVSQLAYLIKVLIGTRVILNNNLTQILQFLVRFVATKKAETITYSSFRTKFYNIETGTRESVRGMLLDMIRYIDKTDQA